MRFDVITCGPCRTVRRKVPNDTTNCLSIGQGHTEYVFDRIASSYWVRYLAQDRFQENSPKDQNGEEWYLIREVSESDCFFNLRYSVRTKMLCDFTKHCR